jgi:hypothetical protein
VYARESELSEQLIGALREKTLERLGYRGREGVDPAILATLDDALGVASRVARPNGAFRLLPVLGIRGKGVQTEAGTIQSAMFARLVEMSRGDRSLVFMIATVGADLERSCGPRDPLHRQLVFDAVGSELAEMVAKGLEAEWSAHAHGLGLQCSRRFSPGYCDWALAGQGVIHASLDAERLGVHLTPHFVMIPRKSVSAVAVVAQEVPVPVPCAFCARVDCTERRATDGSGS